MSVRARHHGNPDGVIEGTLAAGASGSFEHKLRSRKPQFVVATVISGAVGGAIGGPSQIIHLGRLTDNVLPQTFPHDLGVTPVLVIPIKAFTSQDAAGVDYVSADEPDPAWERDLTDETQFGLRVQGVGAKGIRITVALWGSSGAGGVSGALSWDEEASDERYVVIRNGYDTEVSFRALCWEE